MLRFVRMLPALSLVAASAALAGVPAAPASAQTQPQLTCGLALTPNGRQTPSKPGLRAYTLRVTDGSFGTVLAGSRIDYVVYETVAGGSPAHFVGTSTLTNALSSGRGVALTTEVFPVSGVSLSCTASVQAPPPVSGSGPSGGVDSGGPPVKGKPVPVRI